MIGGSEDASTVRKNVVAPAAFLEKLYDIMENASLSPYISWQPDGMSFLIRDVQAVSEFVLPYYFKHNNIQSFVRQLNMYNFTKTRHDSNYREFRQPWFQRGRRHLLSMIKRKSQTYADKHAIEKRKYDALESKNDPSHTVALTDEVSVETGKDWDGDDEGIGEEVSTSSVCSSDYGGIERQRERSRELEELRTCMAEIEAQMLCLHERYKSLSASYANLYHKFDTYENLHAAKHQPKCIPEKRQCTKLSQVSTHVPPPPKDDAHHLSRIVSVDRNSGGPVEADLTLGSCNHLTDANLILPTSGKIEKSSSQEDEQNDNLCELVVDKEISVGVDKECSETSMKPMDDADKLVPDMGLDAMATAVSLRCLTALPSSSTTTESNARSSLDDLVHAANSGKGEGKSITK